ncbi:MAG: hypothetical protein ACLU99_11800 [Alphaproteobacteria bacterium]
MSLPKSATSTSKNFAVIQELNLAGRHTPNRTGLQQHRRRI